ncbi:PAS domain S-box protein (plasmid) [Halorussus salilacus]|uniref:GAF domain-containing protein n=1 Tax=Halorussus salilacus TaxID=2953750 RepID=UPI0020A13F44|nr:GAF domain-containing protein [Halorussus salilacus]USZ69887.1 PAS domain S-box protein [Halorussus salilacus]
MLQEPGVDGSRRGKSRRALYVGDSERARRVVDATDSNGLASATGAADALARLESEPVDCVVAEADLPDADGAEFLDAVGELFPGVARLLVGDSVSDAPEGAGFVAGQPTVDLPARLTRRVERAVERSEAARARQRYTDGFETLVEASPDAMVIIDEDCEVVFANPAIERVFGYDPASVVGESAEKLLCERVHEDLRETTRELRDDEGRVERDYVELPGRHRDGREIPLAVSFRETVRGARHYFSCIVRDVSGRKRLEERLGAEKRKTRELHEVAVMLEECETAEEVCRLAVETAEQLLEFDLAAVDVVEDGELVPQAVSKGVPTDGYYTTTPLDADDNLAARAYRAGRTIRTADLHDEGVNPAASGYRSALTVPMQGQGVFQAVSKDVGSFGESDRELAELLVAHVTQALRRIKSEEALEAERDRFAALFENVPEPIADYEFRDGEPIVRSVNEAFEAVFGYDAEEAVGRSLDDLITPENERGEAERLNERVRTGERVDAEVRREADDGVRTFLLRNAEVSGSHGNYVIYTDITEQKEREERHRSMTEDVLDNTDVGIFVLDDEFDVAWVNRSVERYFGLDREQILGRDKQTLIEEQIRDAVEDDEQFVETVTATYDDNTYVEEFTCHVLPGEGRRERHLQHLSQPIESGLYEGGRVELYYDVTERVEREEMLDTLNKATKELMAAESQRDISDTAVETVREVLDLPHSTVFRWNEDEEVLETFSIPEETTDEFGDPPTFEPGEGLVGTAFEEGRVSVWNDAQDDPRAHEEGNDSIRGFGVLPLGEWGAMTIISQQTGTFDEYKIDLARVLAANTEVALNRAAREEELADQRGQLAELDRINEVIRDIDQLLVRASTREEIERGVCERLAESAHYKFAWTGEATTRRDRIEPTASAGNDDGYLEEVTLPVDHDELGTGPAGRAVQSGETEVVSNIPEAELFEPWREQALERGFESMAAIPLRYRDTVYGALCVYADRPNAFDDREAAVLAELGETIGHAINAVENKRALLSDDVVEIEFSVHDGDGYFARVAREEECSFSLEGLTMTSDGSFVYFMTADGIDLDRVRESADAADDIESVRVVNKHEDGHLFEFVYTGPSPLPALVDHGGTLREATFDESGGRSVVELPRNADVRSVVESIVGIVPGAEVVAQRERQRPERTVQEFRTSLEDELTDRQRSALEAAFYAGFFEWPRESTGEEVSESLGVSAPTFHQHLRVGERKLLASFLDE